MRIMWGHHMLTAAFEPTHTIHPLRHSVLHCRQEQTVNAENTEGVGFPGLFEKNLVNVVYRWWSWKQYGSDVVVIYRVVSPSTWSIVLRVNAACAYTWRAPLAHMEPMHSLTAAPCPIISKYGSKVKDRITCYSIGSGPLGPPLLMNAIN